MSVFARRLCRGAFAVAIASFALTPVAPPAHAQQARLACPYAFFLANGRCYPYSWSGVEFTNDVTFASHY